MTTATLVTGVVALYSWKTVRAILLALNANWADTLWPGVVAWLAIGGSYIAICMGPAEGGRAEKWREQFTAIRHYRGSDSYHYW